MLMVSIIINNIYYPKTYIRQCSLVKIGDIITGDHTRRVINIITDHYVLHHPKKHCIVFVYRYESNAKFMVTAEYIEKCNCKLCIYNPEIYKVRGKE